MGGQYGIWASIDGEGQLRKSVVRAWWIFLVQYPISVAWAIWCGYTRTWTWLSWGTYWNLLYILTFFLITKLHFMYEVQLKITPSDNSSLNEILLSSATSSSVLNCQRRQFSVVLCLSLLSLTLWAFFCWYFHLFKFGMLIDFYLLFFFNTAGKLWSRGGN